jgi:hypothetical protein
MKQRVRENRDSVLGTMPGRLKEALDLMGVEDPHEREAVLAQAQEKDVMRMIWSVEASFDFPKVVEGLSRRTWRFF